MALLNKSHRKVEEQMNNLNNIQKSFILLIVANFIIGDPILMKTIGFGGDNPVMFTNPFDSGEYMAQVFWGINLIAIFGIFLFKKET